jgi:hypothetical protein
MTEAKTVKNFRVVVIIEQGSGPNPATVRKINIWSVTKIDINKRSINANQNYIKSANLSQSTQS